MRKSNKTEILDAAFRVIQRDGVTGLTYESVAAEAGLTKGGLLYHYPSRDALITGLHAHLAAQWENELARQTQGDPRSASTDARLTAYIHTTARSASRADLLLLLDTASDPEATPWAQILDHWAPPAPTDHADPDTMLRFVARLAADGLWLYDALAHDTIPEDRRSDIAASIIALLGDSPITPLGSPE